MRNEGYLKETNFNFSLHFPRQAIIGTIMIVALLAFEIFNFDTTQYALENLLGGASFLTVGWATILAIAFCAIDFAGLAYLFTPDRGSEETKEAWYLMGAWLLGATMNALLTWWAVSLTLLTHDFGNEVLSREQLLSGAPVFVAVLVWLTRILFIGSISVAGEHLFVRHTAATVAPQPQRPVAAARPPLAGPHRSHRPMPGMNMPQREIDSELTTDEVPSFLDGYRPRPVPMTAARNSAFEGEQIFHRDHPDKGLPPREHRRPASPLRRSPVTMQARSRRLP